MEKTKTISSLPEVQIEQFPILRESYLVTLKRQGFQIGVEEIDVESGRKFRNIYFFGNIKKRIFYESEG